MQQVNDSRVVISVLGDDRPGIVAGVSTVLAKHKVNIEDITQTVLQDTFTMTMIVDINEADASFDDIKTELISLDEKLGVQTLVQKEELFNYMYRL